MPEARAAADVLEALVLSGLMGMVGQGARTIVGLKKLSDLAGKPPSQADEFEASRIVVGLMIGFVAGVAAGLALHVLDRATIDVSTLLGLAAAGYTGADFIEGFLTTVPGVGVPPRSVASGTGPTVAAAEVPERSLKAPGVPFSLNRELQAAAAYKPVIDACAAQLSLPADLLYAVGSRESAWGLTLKPKGPAGTGDWAPRHGAMPPDGLGWGRGLMQADYAASEFAKGHEWGDPEKNIRFGATELAENIEFYRKATYPGVDPVRAGVAAYNCGRGNVDKALTAGKDVDHLTTGQDYSRDVLRRAEWFKANAR